MDMLFLKAPDTLKQPHLLNDDKDFNISHDSNSALSSKTGGPVSVATV
jgi:hypothetical protein